MAALTGEQVAQYLYQAGFRGEDLINMLAIAKRESGWQPDAHRTDQPKSALSGDMGLFQINYSNWTTVSQALGLTSKTQLFDPAINAAAAKVLFDRSGYAPWTMGSNGWQAGGDPFRGTDRAEAAAIVGGTSLGGNPAPSPYNPAVSGAPTGQPAGPFNLPSDARIIHNTGSGKLYAAFVMNGVNILYDLPYDGNVVNLDPNKFEHLDPGTFDTIFPANTIVNAGSALELATVSTSFGTFGSMWDSIVGQVMGYNNPARNDPGVIRVLAEFAARPDMSEAELQNRLQATSWYQGKTQEELEYNSVSDAERTKRLDETKARMVGAWFQFGGEQVSMDDPRITNYAEKIASGQLGFGAWTEIVKQQVQANPESPWSREVRQEQEAQRQRPIDIENTAQRIRETAERWGVQWSPDTVNQWAKELVEKRSSDEDLLSTLRDQANVLYGSWKPPELETATAAAPWIETYKRVMEGQANLFTPQVQQALTQGTPIFEFETQLKKTDGWLGTKNGQDTMYGAISEMGRRMGFV